MKGISLTLVLTQLELPLASSGHPSEPTSRDTWMIQNHGRTWDKVLLRPKTTLKDASRDQRVSPSRLQAASMVPLPVSSPSVLPSRNYTMSTIAKGWKASTRGRMCASFLVDELA